MTGSVGDEEKGIDQDVSTRQADSALSSESPSPQDTAKSGNFFQRLNERILSIHYLEKRGFERVEVSNITANNIAVGMLGPLAYDLGFTDSALCAAFGAVLGAAGAAYMSTFGPESGNRTMVCILYVSNI
jgi:hypothetical protein